MRKPCEKGFIPDQAAVQLLTLALPASSVHPLMYDTFRDLYAHPDQPAPLDAFVRLAKQVFGQTSSSWASITKLARIFTLVIPHREKWLAALPSHVDDHIYANECQKQLAQAAALAITRSAPSPLSETKTPRCICNTCPWRCALDVNPN